MKPKFRIGDRVRTIETGEKLVVIDIGDSWREEDPFTYLLAGEMGRYDGGYSAWYPGAAIELVGCGIPAPALRWNPSGVWAKVLGAFFRIAYNGMKYNCLIGEEVFDQGYTSIDEAREACQVYWQQLWDKEMLISRDLPETGE